MGILLGNPAGAEDPPLALGIPQGQTTVDGGVLQLIDQRRDEGGLAAAGQAGDRQPDVAIPQPGSPPQRPCAAGTDHCCSSLLRIKA